jgi:hypothetical protein
LKQQFLVSSLFNFLGLNGLASPSGIPAKIWGGEWKGKQGTRKKPREISLGAREQS